MFTAIWVGMLVMTGVMALGFVLSRAGSRDRARVRARIVQEFNPVTSDEGIKPLYKNLDVLALDSVQEYALLADGITIKPANRPGWKSRLEERLRKSGLRVPVNAFLGIVAGSALFLALAGAATCRTTGAAMGLVAGLCLPFLVIHVRYQMRQETLLRQLPSAFQLMARVIRSGQTVSQAFQAVGEAFVGPLASEFFECQQRQNLGLPLEVVLKEMAVRSGTLELRIFFMALIIQRQTGGNLSDVLERLATTLHTRLRVRQQVRTLTAEGRLQGMTLLVLPFVMFVAMYIVNRSYAAALFNHRPLLVAMAISMIVGVVWIRRIVNFDA